MHKSHVWIVLSCALAIVSCNNSSIQAEKEIQDNNSEINDIDHGNIDTIILNTQNANSHLDSEVYFYYTLCDSIKQDSNIYIQSYSDSILTVDLTQVYCSPLRESRIIDSIPFNTWINPDTLYSNTLLGTQWLKVEYNGKYGFIRNLNVYSQSIKYFPNCIAFGDNKSDWVIKSFLKDNPHRIQDSFKFRFASVNCSLELLKHNGLKHTNTVLKYNEVSQTHGGVQIVNVNEEGKISLIVESNNYSDWEYEEFKLFYYPIEINDSIYFVVEARVEAIYDEEQGKLTIDSSSYHGFKYHDTINIPSDELIVKISEEYYPIIKNGKVITDDGTDYGRPLLELTKSSKSYYRWNGDSLISQ